MSNNSQVRFKTIFIVDDEEMFQEGAKAHLQRKNRKANVQCYGSGEECVANLKLDPELIVLDHHLAPEGSSAMNGLQTLQKIKETNKDAFVVILTGEDSVQVANDTMEHGAFDYIVKGDTAFAKLDINCTHILKQIGDARELADFKKFKMGFIALIAVFVIILYFLAGF